MTDPTPLTEPETPNPDPVTSPSGSANGRISPEFARALIKAQSEMPAIEKDAVNPHFRSRHTSLDHLLAEALPVLNRNGLAIVQFPTTGPSLRTLIVHESGGILESEMPLMLDKQNSQGQGSAITYAKRYAVSAALAISSEEDDDGNQASQPSPDRRGPHGGRTAAAPAPTSPSAPPPAETPEQHRQRLTQHWDDAKLADLNNRIGAIDDEDMLRTLLEIEGERELRGKGKPRKTLLIALSARIQELEAVGDQAVTGSALEEASHSGDPVPPPTSSDGEPPPADASRSPETAQDTGPASPSDHLPLVQAALAFIQEQPGSVEQPSYWTVPNVLLGISQQGGEAYASLADVPEEWLEAVFNAVPAEVQQAVRAYGPEQLSALAAQAK